MPHKSSVPWGRQSIKIEEVDGYTIHRNPSRPDVWPIVCAFRQNESLGEVLSNWHPGTRVVRIEYDGKFFVLKWILHKCCRWEKRLQEKIHGSFYPRLMRQMMAARTNGCDTIQEIFLVAERVLSDGLRETFIVMEYIDGKPLTSGRECFTHRREVVAAFASLHRHRLALGDVNYKNFILNGNNITIIDLSSRGFFRLGRIKDVVRMRLRYHINLPVHGIVDHFLFWLILLQHQIFYRMRLLRNTKTNPLRPKAD